MTTPEPETDGGRAIRAHMSPARWAASVAEALRRVEILDAIQARRESNGESWKRCLQAVAPDTSWSKYLHWRRRHDSCSGPAWERLLDRRLPPMQRISEDVVHAARALRRADRRITCKAARELLRAEFGAELAVSDTSLKRLWRAADLGYVFARGGGAVGEEC